MDVVGFPPSQGGGRKPGKKTVKRKVKKFPGGKKRVVRSVGMENEEEKKGGGDSCSRAKEKKNKNEGIG